VLGGPHTGHDISASIDRITLDGHLRRPARGVDDRNVRECDWLLAHGQRTERADEDRGVQPPHGVSLEKRTKTFPSSQAYLRQQPV
jgi:hypothetical protein